MIFPFGSQNSQQTNLPMHYDAYLETVDEANKYLDSLSDQQPILTWYRRCVNIQVNYPAFGTGGVFYVEGFRNSEKYEWQTVTIYTGPNGYKKFARSKMNSVWGKWGNTNSYYNIVGSYSGDCNNLNAPGIFGQLVSNASANGPGFWSYITVFKHDNGITQIAFGYSENKVSIRVYYGNQWSSWKEL